MIKFFDEINKGDISIAGGKGANLGELTGAGFNVPNGFIVTTKAYDTFVDMKKLSEDIRGKLKNLDFEEHDKLEKVSNEIKKLISDEELLEDLKNNILKALKKLNGNKFAVRSSATAEDLITASFAGQQDTYLDVKSGDVISKVKDCWASLFNPRAIYYRNEKKISQDVSMAVAVQEMVSPEFAGVMFTVDPIRKKYILIEGAHGLGEKVVSGEVTPSSFMLDRENFEIIEETINFEIDKDIIKNIAKMGIKIEAHYKIPQDVEYAVKNNKIFILQSRAITTL